MSQHALDDQCLPNGRHWQFTHCSVWEHSSSGLTALGSHSQPASRHLHCLHSFIKMLIFWGQPNGLSLLVFWGKNHLHLVGFRRNHSLKVQNIWCKTYSKMMGCTLLYTFTLFAKLIERTKWIWVGCAGIAITTCKSYYHHLMSSFCHYLASWATNHWECRHYLQEDTCNFCIPR